MRKFAFVCALVISFMGLSVYAQQKPAPKPIGPPIIQFDHEISIEDDATGSFLVFDPNTGVYKFYRCRDGSSMSGKGVVKVNGCAITLEDLQSDHRVLASINVCDQAAKAAIETLTPRIAPSDFTPMKEYLSDFDMRNNTLSCASSK